MMFRNIHNHAMGINIKSSLIWLYGCAASIILHIQLSALYLRKIYNIMKKQVIKTTKQAAKDISKYNSARQKRCWAVVVEALQQFIPGNEEIDWKNSTPNELRDIIPFSKNDTFVVSVNPKYVVSKGRSVKPTLLKMQKVNVIEEVDKDGIKHSYPLFYDIMEHNGEYSIGLPFLSLKWLLNFTKETGYVSFCVQSFIRLVRPSAMMTYLYISSNLKRGKWVAKIEDVRKWVCAPDHLDSWKFLHKYLDAAIQEFEKAGTRLRFSYKKITGASPARGGTPMIEKIEFTVIDRGAPDPIDIDPDDDCYEEEGAFENYDNTQQEMTEAERWDEWDKIAEERRRQYEKHSA